MILLSEIFLYIEKRRAEKVCRTFLSFVLILQLRRLLFLLLQLLLFS